MPIEGLDPAEIEEARSKRGIIPRGSAWGLVVLADFKSVGVAAQPGWVGSIPTRFRHSPVTDCLQLPLEIASGAADSLARGVFLPLTLEAEKAIGGGALTDKVTDNDLSLVGPWRCRRCGDSLETVWLRLRHECVPIRRAS